MNGDSVTANSWDRRYADRRHHGSQGRSTWTWLDTAGHQHSDALHVIERFHRTPGSAKGRLRIHRREDPEDVRDTKSMDQLAPPERPLKPTPGLPDLLEYNCEENNRDPSTICGATQDPPCSPEIFQEIDIAARLLLLKLLV